MNSRATPQYPSWLPLLLGFLSATGPLSTDMYLPAFPSIEADFGLPLGSAQITLAAWFLGLGFGQITQGTLADRYGRRAPLMISTAIYTLANIGCALAPDLLWLSLLRLLAAFSGSASMVIPRAVVRDLSSGHEAAKMMSRLILVSGVAPILAPTLGGLMLMFASWRGIFWFAAVYGGICWLLVMRYLPDTLPVEQRLNQNIWGLLRRYWELGVEPSFISNALMYGLGMFALFAFIGGSPGVFIDGMHFSPSAYALVFSACAACFVLFSQLNPSLLMRFGQDALMRATMRVFLGAAVVLIVMAFTTPYLPGGTQWWMVMLPAMVLMGSQGLNLPNSTVAGLQRHATRAGSASALMGMIGFCLAAVSGLAVGQFSDGSARAIGTLALIGALGANIADHYRRRDVRR